MRARSRFDLGWDWKCDSLLNAKPPKKPCEVLDDMAKAFNWRQILNRDIVSLRLFVVPVGRGEATLGVDDYHPKA